MVLNSVNSIELSIFSSRLAAVCGEMGAVLQRAAFSPNIRDRLDYSCAVFNDIGELCAQAAHIPVHLGSMAYAMADIVKNIEWHEQDMIVVNDPFLGGTHLPDVTLIAPIFVENKLVGFVANRAHHADIGGHTPGSMPISRTLEEEGVIIPPTYLIREGELVQEVLDSIFSQVRGQQQLKGDFFAQISANRLGVASLRELISSTEDYSTYIEELNNYAHRMSLAAFAEIPNGSYSFSDVMDDDGAGNEALSIKVSINVTNKEIVCDFKGTAAQADGNINCPLSVTAAGVFYVFRCLMPTQMPECAGSFRAIKLHAPLGCLLNAERPAAVAAGNVETSTRIVDVVLGALAQAIPDRIPAASHGSMNNLAMGGYYQDSDNEKQSWDYYETIGGGMGASSHSDGISAVQTHMTNTLNTPIEVFESEYPVRVLRYQIRHGSGGEGLHKGGDGMIREFEFLAPSTVTLLTERRLTAPWGLNGGQDGAPGINRLNGKILAGKTSMQTKIGDRLTIETAGAGGWGEVNQ